jgi:hypothetical protein
VVTRCVRPLTPEVDAAEPIGLRASRVENDPELFAQGVSLIQRGTVCQGRIEALLLRCIVIIYPACGRVTAHQMAAMTMFLSEAAEVAGGHLGFETGGSYGFTSYVV